jgi:ABC-type antimicrobial peptide transport system permease subunit
MAHDCRLSVSVVSNGSEKASLVWKDQSRQVGLCLGFQNSWTGSLACPISLSAVVTREIQSLLYGTRPLDPTVFGLVSLVLLLVAGAACVFPAWRASRLDPMQALRTE